MKKEFFSVFIRKPFHAIVFGLILLLYVYLQTFGYSFFNSISTEKYKSSSIRGRSHFFHK